MIRSADARRYARIAIIAALMAAVVFVAGRSLHEETTTARLAPADRGAGSWSAPADPGPPADERLAAALARAAEPPPGARLRTLERFYALRAYPGAPPYLPHPILDETAAGGRACLQCHGDGGWVPHLNAYTPLSPHGPELVSCLQCHVPAAATGVFRATTFPRAPAATRTSTDDVPDIPHGLAMRENCLACHAGAAAVVEIRTTHPEMVTCRDCHALAPHVAGQLPALADPAGGAEAPALGRAAERAPAGGRP